MPVSQGTVARLLELVAVHFRFPIPPPLPEVVGARSAHPSAERPGRGNDGDFHGPPGTEEAMQGLPEGAHRRDLMEAQRESQPALEPAPWYDLPMWRLDMRWACAANFLIWAGCNDPTYLAGARSIETAPAMGGGFSDGADLYVLP